MKRIIIPALALLLGLTSCNWLERNPKATLAPENYFRDETDLQLFSNSFYNNLLPKEPFDEQSDHYVYLNLSAVLRGGTNRTVPNSGGGWGNGSGAWGDLRKMNTLLEYIDKCEDKDAGRQGRGREIHGRHPVLPRVPVFQYGQALRRRAVDRCPAGDRQRGTLQAPRKPRGDHGPHDRRYRFCHRAPSGRCKPVPGEPLERPRAEGPFLPVRGNLPYRLLFAEPDADRGEYILAIRNDQSLTIFNNSTAFATMPTQGCPGLTRKFVASFLMADGSRFTDQPGWETMQFKDEMVGRDPRLAAITVTPGYIRLGDTEVSAPDLGSSVTGYQLVKFVMDSTLPGVGRVDMSFNDMPVFRLGEVYLNYAEAKAELGTLTQDDLDITVNKLRDRVGMQAHLDLAAANADPDPFLLSEEYGYRNVSGPNQGVILEIRRERGVELADEGFRLSDLIRWREGKCLEQPLVGMYFPGAGEYDLTGDGKPDLCLWSGQDPKHKDMVDKEIGADTGVILSDGDKGCLDHHQNVAHVFDENRDYYFPIPTKERQLNPQLKQNPGWNDGLSF